MTKYQRRVLKWLTSHKYTVTSWIPVLQKNWVCACYVKKCGHYYLVTASTCTELLIIEVLKRKEVEQLYFADIP